MKENQDDITSLEYLVTASVILFFGFLYFLLNHGSDFWSDKSNAQLADQLAETSILSDRSRLQEGLTNSASANDVVPVKTTDAEDKTTEGAETEIVQQKVVDKTKQDQTVQKAALDAANEDEEQRLAEIETLRAEEVHQQEELARLKAEDAARQAEIKQLKDEKEALRLAEIAKLDAEIKQLEADKAAYLKREQEAKKAEEKAAAERAEAEKETRSAAEISVDQSLGEFEKAILEKRYNTPIVFDEMNFNTGSAKLSQPSKAQINTIAELLKKHNDVQLLIRGHTDNTGSLNTNTLLSKARSQSVKSELVEQGVDAKRLSAEGVGSGEPIAANDTPESRKKNRRIELIISE